MRTEQDGLVPITASILITMSFDVPAAWVVEGQMANEEGIVAQTVEALWDGNVPLACVLDSWSFA